MLALNINLPIIHEGLIITNVMCLSLILCVGNIVIGYILMNYKTVNIVTRISCAIVFGILNGIYTVHYPAVFSALLLMATLTAIVGIFKQLVYMER